MIVTKYIDKQPQILDIRQNEAMLGRSRKNIHYLHKVVSEHSQGLVGRRITRLS